MQKENDVCGACGEELKPDMEYAVIGGVKYCRQCIETIPVFEFLDDLHIEMETVE